MSRRGLGILRTETAYVKPLTFASLGECVEVRSIKSTKPELLHFLENLGFVEGSHVRVAADNQGNLIVEIKGSRVALDKSVAARISVVSITE